MSEDAFESRLSGLFRDEPALPDAAEFAAAVEGRLERDRWLRPALLAGAGLIGGAGSWALGAVADLGGMLRAAEASSSSPLEGVLAALGAPMPAAAPPWIAAGLLAVLLAGALRAAQEI